MICHDTDVGVASMTDTPRLITWSREGIGNGSSGDRIRLQCHGDVRVTEFSKYVLRASVEANGIVSTQKRPSKHHQASKELL